MIDSNKILEETKLTNATKTVFIDNLNAVHHFTSASIVSNGRSAFETANLINNKLS